MPSTVQIAVAMQGLNNFVTESLNDVYVTQFGRHNVVNVPVPNQYSTYLWPASGETIAYIKFPQQGAPYTITITQDTAASGKTLVFVVPAGSGFTPFIVPLIKAAADNSVYLAIMSTVQIPSLPIFYW